MSILTMTVFSSTFLDILGVSYFGTLSINSVIFVTLDLFLVVDFSLPNGSYILAFFHAQWFLMFSHHCAQIWFPST